MTSVADRSTESAATDPGAQLAADTVAKLRATFATGRTLPLEWRKRQIEGIGRLVTEREVEIADALAADLGRTPHEAWFGDVASTKGEVEFALKHLKKWMKPTRTRVPLTVLPGKAAYRYEPLGTVMVIGPWNYPFYLTLSPLIGALAAGNTVVIKPSEHAPATSAALARLIPEYLDSEAVIVVEGEASITQKLIEQRLDLVFFTGGTDIGRRIAEACAPHLTPAILELGGKSPVIVTKNADLEVAARRIAFGKLLNSGQTCVAPDYLLVDKSVREEFVSKLKATLTEFQGGSTAPQKIVNDRQFSRLAGMLEGQDIVAGGNPDSGATTMEPTVVLNPDRRSPLMQGEIFGPILPIIDITSLDEAIAFINDGEKPLAAYIFSKNKAEQMRVIEEVPAGGVVANHIAMQVLTPQLPFGGVGHSGMGAYHGKWGYEAFSHRKATLRMPSRPDLKMIYPPYSERDKKILRKLV
ncbi:aldehyde dehydrogenase family protein [Sporichthya sp.]|uniref:aldehyde dehydrogenase family protein n=1 Tax=Sporichthya sp. TaxID=65475 RepID=UPI001843D08A|nr:aldehyde dehydrogenase family protein [Sporichthya sp.]MBA3744297.1 aldehyde dehydrogenase family protein [Sporichthya sp.]